uniref:Uncharacterized protein n=1 Tax=Rhipicephalus zambeziensis TaxID=60191 RepID=A0A224Y7X8_9ACAR
MKTSAKLTNWGTQSWTTSSSATPPAAEAGLTNTCNLRVSWQSRQRPSALKTAEVPILCTCLQALIWGNQRFRPPEHGLAHRRTAECSRGSPRSGHLLCPSAALTCRAFVQKRYQLLPQVVPVLPRERRPQGVRRRRNLAVEARRSFL